MDYVLDSSYWRQENFLFFTIENHNFRKLNNYDSDKGRSMTSRPYLESYKKHFFKLIPLNRL